MNREGARKHTATREQLGGCEAIAAALDAGRPIRLLLARRGSADPTVGQLTERARRAGIRVETATANDLRRMSRWPRAPDVLALLGSDPEADSEAFLAAGGAAWLLVGIRYPGNAGFAIRTAEVSGADAVFLDVAFEAAARKQARRASMYADRFMPVRWDRSEEVIEQARRAQRRVLAIEDSGRCAPWEMDLRGPVLFLIGGEEKGIPPQLLDRCDEVLRIPMAGFIPSYNLQAAMAIVAGERLRQEFE